MCNITRVLPTRYDMMHVHVCIPGEGEGERVLYIVYVYVEREGERGRARGRGREREREREREGEREKGRERERERGGCAWSCIFTCCELRIHLSRLACKSHTSVGGGLDTLYAQSTY